VGVFQMTKQQRTEGPEDGAGDRAAHQYCEDGLMKAQIETEQRREQGVQQSVAERSQQNGERQFERSVKSLQRGAPPPHGGTESSRAKHNDDQIQCQLPRPEFLNAKLQALRFPAQENGQIESCYVRGHPVLPGRDCSGERAKNGSGENPVLSCPPKFTFGQRFTLYYKV
jgi:hypothetical protein